jgi:esterase/lipase superfamily enzyme
MINGRAVATSLALLTLLAFALIPIQTSLVATARQQQPPAQNTNRVERPTTSPCPYAVSISAPNSVDEGGVITFSSDVDYSGKSALSYTWTVSPTTARIVSGEGTPTINVDTTNVERGRITATLIVDDGSGDPACRQRAEVETRVLHTVMMSSPSAGGGAPRPVDVPAATPRPPAPTPFPTADRSPASTPVTSKPERPLPPTARARRESPPESMVGSSAKARSAEPVAAPSPEPAKGEDFTRVQVFYGTDRNRTGARAAAKFYGTGRGDLELGTCEVSIPKSHQAGQLESPSWWHMEFHEDEKRDIMLRKVEPLDRAKFYEQYQAELGKARSRDVFVFVHGYRVSFEDSARRTAQLAYDLGFPGVPVMYSWPSKGTLGGYLADENNVGWTKPHLKQFLSDLSAQSNGARIHLIAHSMGNRALTEAMHDIALVNPTPLFSEVILTAPDIDADYFKNEIAPAIQKIALRVTLYASSDDKALLASKKAHGEQRAGDSAPHIVVVPGIDTVDASGIDTSVLGLGHSYFAEAGPVLADITLLLINDKPPAERSLREQLEGTGKYWKFSSSAAAAVTTSAAIAAQGNQSSGASLLSFRFVLLLAVLLVACAVGVWLVLRSARNKSA